MNENNTAYALKKS